MIIIIISLIVSKRRRGLTLPHWIMANDKLEGESGHGGKIYDISDCSRYTVHIHNQPDLAPAPMVCHRTKQLARLCYACLNMLITECARPKTLPFFGWLSRSLSSALAFHFELGQQQHKYDDFPLVPEGDVRVCATQWVTVSNKTFEWPPGLCDDLALEGVWTQREIDACCCVVVRATMATNSGLCGPSRP